MSFKVHIELSDGTVAYWSRDYATAGISEEDAELMENEVLDDIEKILGKADSIQT